jgi:acyl carrier protein
MNENEKIFDVEVADEIIDSTRTVQDIITLVNDLS